MRRITSRKRSQRNTQSQLSMERLENRLLLACDMRTLNDGTLQITGDSRPQIVQVVDQGNGLVDVQCQEGNGPIVSRNFSGVSGIKGNLKGGNDQLNYFSDQDVNASLSSLEFLMGAGHDRANLEITLEGTPNQSRGFGFVIYGDAGNDTLNTTINSMTSSNNPTQPVVRGIMEGGVGRDEMTLVSNTAAGGFVLASKERSASTGTSTQEDCLIWDLIDGDTGRVNAQVMGSEVNELMTFQTDARGIGRSNFDISMDGGGGVNALNAYLTYEGETQGKVNMSGGAEMHLEVQGVVDLKATSRNQVHWDDGYWQLDFRNTQGTRAASLDFVGTNGPDNVRILIRENRLDALAVNVDTGTGNDIVEVDMTGVVNYGRFEQSIDTGGGADTVIQSIHGFTNHGAAFFNTRLGVGADIYLGVASNIYVASGASFAMTVNGGGGNDLILAAMQATVDGNYRFVARGGAGNDVMGVVQQFDTNWRSGYGSAQRPAMDILLEGNDGNDLIGLWVSIANGDEDLVDALVDGGLGYDTALTHGPARVINVERHN